MSLGMGRAKARPGCQPMGGGESGLTRGTSVRHSPTMVGQGCRKRTLACQVRAHSPAQLGGVGHLRGPWPKVADEGWGRPCHSFPLAMLGSLPHVVSQSKVLRGPQQGSCSACPCSTTFKEAPQPWGHSLSAPTCHWLILSGCSSQMLSFKKSSSGCKILPSCKYITCLGRCY